MTTVNLFFDTRATKDGLGVIKIIVTHNRAQRLYTTGIKTDAEQWKQLPKKGEKLDNRVKDETRLKLYADIYSTPNGFYRRAESIIEALGVNFDFDTFKDLYDNWGIEKKVEAEKTDLLKALSAKSETLLKNGQVSHGTNFGALGKSLQRFIHTLTKSECKEYGLSVGNVRNPQPLKLEYRHVTPDFLKHYQEWMEHEGKAPQSPKSKPTGVSITTVSIYTRALRTLFNEAIEAGIVKQESYPFSTRKGSSKYSIPESENIKKALSRTDIDKIKSYVPEPDSMEQRAHDLWLLSYYGNGMNVADICRLKRSNLTADYLHFERTKTKVSNKKPLIISVKLRDEMRQIMERHGHTDKNKNAYLFPFLVKCKDSKEEKQAIHQVIKMTNKYMKRIGEKLGIEGDLNTYAARHSFATTLQRTGAPISFIQGKLGHKKSTTTEIYLAGFEPEQESKFLSEL
ncbi:tyrosine-type recombinase/integrase [Runella sp.]|uniref:tyrosine-type recombinase/integrase n=1 Tax=Runella sp. TaxID=1960881 RepID=UPI0030180E6D